MMLRKLRHWVCAVACAALALPPWAAEAPAAAPVHLYTTVAGDTLIGIGQRYLVEPAAWPQVARASGLRHPNRLPVGMALRIPLALMRTEPSPATVIAVVGETRTQQAVALQPGQLLAEGADLRTGADGSVTVRLVDGTLLRLRSQSRLQIEQSSRLPDADVVRSSVRLEQGRVEIQAKPAQGGQPGFRIDTPQGVLGVRGTEFRVTTDGTTTRSEVLEGLVAVQGRVQGVVQGQSLAAGFGTVVDNAGAVAAPVALLGGPDLSGLPTLQDSPLVRFTLPLISGAQAYRAQVARDAGFDEVVADVSSPTPLLRFADLPDGDYVLRVRGVDVRGLEGRDADFRFRLKARPEPPLPSQPQPRAVLFGDTIEFAWAANDAARSYRLQVALNERFEPLLGEPRETQALGLSLQGLVPGTYFWRLASIRADGDAGPFGAVQRFEIKREPPPPKAPTVGDQSISFSWDALPGQTFGFQLSRDLGFNPPLLERQLSQPGVELPLPGSGRFYVRVRVQEADGFVWPYSAPQRFEVPNCVRASDGSCVRVDGAPLLVTP